MSSIVFLFSGQGSQYPGMGRELLQTCPAANRIYECGSDILGFDVKKLCFEGTEEELSQTKVSQPAIFTTSLVALEAVKEKGVTAKAVAGHSLGEYAALVAAGIVSMEHGFQLIAARASAMQKCADEQDGGMCAVMGLEPSEIEAVCEAIDGYVIPVNYNSPSQTVIAGESGALEQASEKFAALGKKCVPLAVNAAFHSELMQPAADEFKAAIQGISFQTPKLPFYSNVTGRLLDDFSDMPAYLSKHLVSPVRFTDELAAISEAGIDTYVELGPNKVLTGLVKKTMRRVPAFHVDSEKTLDKMLEKLEA